MTKGKLQIILITVLSAVLALCAAGILLSGCCSDKQRVLIIQNGVILYRLDLQAEEDRTIRIDGENGCFSLIEIKDHTICVKDADCPDRVCVRTGVLRSENIPVVCLPNRLIVRFAEENE